MKIAVVGLGRVGLVAAACLAENGHEVEGFDLNPIRLENLRAGLVDFYEPGLDLLVRKGAASGAFTVSHPSQVDHLDVDAVFIAVGTPTVPNQGADLSSVYASIEWVQAHQNRNIPVVMKSTLPPGTGRDLIVRYGLNYVSNPEFQQEGRAIEDWLRPSRIVVGLGDPSLEGLVRDLYTGISSTWSITDVTTAEMIKYASNAFLATKISFINEIANLCDLVLADIDGVSQGMGLDHRIGSAFLGAGIGFGGSCFPKDVEALELLARDNGHKFELLRSVVSVNDRQRRSVLTRLRQLIPDLSGASVAVLGLSFKPETDDIRESPGVDIARWLSEDGAAVRAYDPMAGNVARGSLPPEVEIFDGALDAVAGAQAVLLCTEWNEFREMDWRDVYGAMNAPKVIIDGRNTLSADELKEIGFEYRGIGRGRTSSCDD